MTKDHNKNDRGFVRLYGKNYSMPRVIKDKVLNKFQKERLNHELKTNAEMKANELIKQYNREESNSGVRRYNEMMKHNHEKLIKELQQKHHPDR
jgi:hypothetical protein